MPASAGTWELGVVHSFLIGCVHVSLPLSLQTWCVLSDAIRGAEVRTHFRSDCSDHTSAYAHVSWATPKGPRTHPTSSAKEEEEDDAAATFRTDYTLSDFHLIHCDVNYRFGLSDVRKQKSGERGRSRHRNIQRLPEKMRHFEGCWVKRNLCSANSESSVPSCNSPIERKREVAHFHVKRCRCSASRPAFWVQSASNTAHVYLQYIHERRHHVINEKHVTLDK